MKFLLERLIISKSISHGSFAARTKEELFRRFSVFLVPSRNIPASFGSVPCRLGQRSSLIAYDSKMSSGSVDTTNKLDAGRIQEKRASASSVDEGKRMAAFTCVDKHVKSGYAIGVGTGTTAKFAVQRLVEKVRGGELKDIVCVPTSFQTRQLILENHLPLGDLEQCPELDVCIDGADEVDEDLNCIKGGGGCLTQEKIVMSCSKYFYVFADSKKMSTHLGDRWTTIPLEVIPLAYAPIKRRVEQLEGGEAKLRMADRKAGPVLTDNGNFILDWSFPKFISQDRRRNTSEWAELNTRLKMIPGVVETGLFLQFAQAAFFGQADGAVTERKASGDRKISALSLKRSIIGSPPQCTVTNGGAKA